jgi:hypothetical protein
MTLLEILMMFIFIVGAAVILVFTAYGIFVGLRALYQMQLPRLKRLLEKVLNLFRKPKAPEPALIQEPTPSVEFFQKMIGAVSEQSGIVTQLDPRVCDLELKVKVLMDALRKQKEEASDDADPEKRLQKLTKFSADIENLAKHHVRKELEVQLPRFTKEVLKTASTVTEIQQSGSSDQNQSQK